MFKAIAKELTNSIQYLLMITKNRITKKDMLLLPETTVLN